MELLNVYLKRFVNFEKCLQYIWYNNVYYSHVTNATVNVKPY